MCEPDLTEEEMLRRIRDNHDKYDSEPPPKEAEEEEEDTDELV